MRLSQKQKGFTLIEILVAVAIVVIIGTIILLNYRSGQRQAELRTETDKLVSTLRKAQNQAISVKTGTLVHIYPEKYNIQASGQILEEISLPLHIKIIEASKKKRVTIPEIHCQIAAIDDLPDLRVAILFPSPSGIRVKFDCTSLVPGQGLYGELCLTLEHQISGQKRYIYMDGDSGRIESMNQFCWPEVPSPVPPGIE